MRQRLVSALSILYRVLDRITPRGNLLCFISSPDFEDNAFSYFEHLAAKRDGPLLVWLTSDPKSTAEGLRNACLGKSLFLQRTKVIKKNSLTGLFQFLRATHVFYTHGHYQFVRPRRFDTKLVNLWHGMPLKAIGAIDRNSVAPSQLSNLTICSSEFFRPIMSKAFDMEEHDVLVTGLPRCDALTQPTEKARMFKEFLSPSSRLIFWLPTYQSSTHGDIRDDSSETRESLISQFETSLGKLSQLASEHDCHFVIKLHPMDFLNMVQIRKLPGISIFTNNQPLPQNLRLYEALAVADGLITDVSSVSFDFMSTKRPILITKWIFDQYARKFCFDPELLLKAAWSCGDWGDAGEFFDAVKNARVQEVKHTEVFCRYQDAEACNRLEQRLSELKKKSAPTP